MKLKSVAGIVCYVKDLNKTAKFYETLGFVLVTLRVTKLKPQYLKNLNLNVLDCFNNISNPGGLKLFLSESGIIATNILIYLIAVL